MIYDTGALLAAERGERRMWVLHEHALERGSVPLVATPVIAQAWRGGPQPRLSRFLRSCGVVPLGETHAREVGRVCARASVSDVVDVFVVVLALAEDALVVTSDADDLLHIARALGRRLEVQEI